MPLRVAAGFLLVVVAVGCRLERLPPPGSARDLEAIRTLVGDFHQSLSDGDAERFQALFDPDAIIVWDDHPARGAAGFWQDVAEWPSAGGPRLVDALPLRLEVRHAGGAATTWAVSVWTVSQADGAPATLEHRAVFLFRQHGDQWRILSLLLRRRPAATGA